jgi:hypothetical protein
VFDTQVTKFRTFNEQSEWVNIYGYFGKKDIWPRGVPLDEAKKELPHLNKESVGTEWNCFQAIVDGDPDLDAVGRMLYPDPHFFENYEPVLLPKSSFCPTNSQACNVYFPDDGYLAWHYRFWLYEKRKLFNSFWENGFSSGKK